MEQMYFENEIFISSNVDYLTEINQNKISIVKEENWNFQTFYNGKPIVVEIKNIRKIIRIIRITYK